MFDKKTVYHSQLVQAGTIEVIIRSEPTQSKFKKEQKFIDFKINGKDHQYIIENEAIEAKLEGLKGQTVQLTATGTRDDADISVTDENGGPVDRRSGNSGSSAAKPPRREAPATNGHAETKAEKDAREFAAMSKAKVYGARCAILWQIAAKHADIVIPEVYAVAEITEAEANDLHMRLTNTLYIEMKQVTNIHDLPVKWIDTHAPEKPQPPPKPKPAPKPEPAAQEPDDDNIPF